MEETMEKVKALKFNAINDEDSSKMIKAMSELPWHDMSIVCIGTDRSTGDAFGPLLGTRLRQEFAVLGIDVPVFGTLNDPVHAVSLERTLRQVETTYTLGTDASLGKFENVGNIWFENSPVRPGAGVNKKLPEVGQWSFTATVNVSGFMEYFVLQNTKLSVVMQLVDNAASVIVQAILEARNNGRTSTANS